MSQYNILGLTLSTPGLVLLLKSSDKRDAGHGGDPAMIVFVPPNLDVALVPPVLGPAVLHQPVVEAGVGVIAVSHLEIKM